MRVRNVLLAAGIALGASAAANAQVYTAGGLPLPINDNVTFTSVLNVPDFFTITDLNVVFKATHTFRGDVDLALVRDGHYIVLSTDNGSGADDYDIRFDQSAPSVVTSYSGAGSGVFRPEGTTGSFSTQGFSAIHQTDAFASLGLLESNAVTSLDFWNGTNAQGTWTLLISDDANGDSGTATYWSLEFNNATDPNGPPPPPPPAPAFPGHFTGTPNTLSLGQTVSGTTIWDPENPQPGLTDGAGEGVGNRYGTFGWDLGGNEVAYRIEHGGGALELYLENLTADLDLALLDSTGTIGGTVATSAGSAGTTAESIVLANLAPGTYYAVVDTFTEPGSNFTLRYVPAPSAVALMGLGGLVAARRRR